MLTAHHLSKSFDLQILFEEVSFSLNPGERTGLVGPNGCGKTTLLRILAGLESPTNGTVSRAPYLRIGYLPQGFELDPSLSLQQIMVHHQGNPENLEQELSKAAEALAHQPSNLGYQNEYDRLLWQLQSEDSGRIDRILAGLGLNQIHPDLAAGKMSGGQKTRLALALVLLDNPQLLLLDEPTNHLDISMLEWLEKWLIRSAYTALIISHDRKFLDHTVSHILDMDPITHRVREYTGNYSAFVVQHQSEIENLWKAYHDQQGEILRMRQDIVRTREQAAHTERQASSIRIGGSDYKQKGYKSYQQGIAKKVAKKAKSRQKKLERYLDSDERVEKPQRAWEIKLELTTNNHLGRSVIYMQDVSIGFDQKNPLISMINLDLHSGQRIALTGPNGCGKTTLLRTISGEIQLLGGSIHLSKTVRLGYLTQDQAGLDLSSSVLETIQEHFANETAARSYLAYYLFTGDEPLKSNHLLSYGQRSRLLLAKLVAEGCNFLLLDEPINHLDIPSRTHFEQALNQYTGSVIAVVHDRYFIQQFADEIWRVENGRIHVGDTVDPTVAV